jgi:hypothetical protein
MKIIYTDGSIGFASQKAAEILIKRGSAKPYDALQKHEQPKQQGSGK